MSLAKPGTQTFVGVFSDQPVYSGWDMELLHYVFWLLFGAIMLGAGGLFLNKMRSKRKGDNIYTSLIVAGVAALAFFLWLVSLKGV
jgi:low temperature requirement protein LtrA